MNARCTVLGKASLIAVLTASAWAPAEAPAQTPSPPECTLRGVARIAPNTPLFGQDGKVIARFTGASSALSASSFPKNARGKVRVETGIGNGSFRISGWLPLAELPVFTAQHVPVIPGHVWLAPDQRVTVLGSAPGRLRVQRQLTPPLQQTLTTWADCDALALAPTGSPPSSRPAAARGYLLERSALALYDQSTADRRLILTLLRSPGAEPMLFFATERRNDWLRVEYHGEIEVNAWAKLSEFKALPAGEIVDPPVHHGSVQSPARLEVQGEPRSVQTTTEVPLRRAPKETDPVIGVIEVGTDTYVLDRAGAWASVMPKTLNVIPPENAQFWAKASDLGL